MVEGSAPEPDRTTSVVVELLPLSNREGWFYTDCDDVLGMHLHGTIGRLAELIPASLAGLTQNRIDKGQPIRGINRLPKSG